ncbi:MAG: 3-deoxy-D-manno-octulosonic acid transferase, partial [Thermoguttaceae bacterium]|nr:3-deoxy-D-manno-octulosonic acid transferase [Thermoguttaceae bacterium]
GWNEKLWGLVPKMEPRSGSGKTGKRVWLHAVSVGEMNLLKPILRELAASHPDWECVLSTTSQTGMELGRRLFPQYPLFYCPLDFSWATATAMRRICPDWLVLVELELWPNLISTARRFGVRTAIVNGRISDESFRRYRWIRRLTLALFKKLDFVAVQDAIAADRFRQLGVPEEKMTVTGSIKFDGVQTDPRNEKTVRLAQLAGIRETDRVFLAGSTQEPEEAFALTTFRTLADEFPDLKLILVPRHPERFDTVADLLQKSGVNWVRRSRLKEPETGDNRRTPKPSDTGGGGLASRILLVDTIGELGAWWGTAQIAFVGGSLGRRGGQNMLEPAAYGAAVSFGPNTRNFRDISSTMLREQAAVVVASQDEMTAFVRRALSDISWRQGLSERARRLVLRQQGATRKTVRCFSEK